MKLLLEFILALVLHPLAVILAWINLLGRSDLGGLEKLVWFLIVTFAWGIGPIFYVILGGGTLW